MYIRTKDKIISRKKLVQFGLNIKLFSSQISRDAGNRFPGKLSIIVSVWTCFNMIILH